MPSTAPRSNYGIYVCNLVVSQRHGVIDRHILRDGKPFAWTKVASVRIDGEPVTRYRLVIEDRHVGLRTPSCGNIQDLDVGAELVVDEYGRLGRAFETGTKGWILKDAIVRPKKQVHAAGGTR